MRCRLVGALVCAFTDGDAIVAAPTAARPLAMNVRRPGEKLVGMAVGSKQQGQPRKNQRDVVRPDISILPGRKFCSAQ